MEMDGQLVINYLIHLVSVSLLVLSIGCERETSKRHFGMHTFTLVVVVTCGCRPVGMSVGYSTDALAEMPLIEAARNSG